MSDNQASYPVATMCRVLGVSPSGFYAWIRRPVSRRASEDADLVKVIRETHAVSKGTYGAPRIHADLAARNIPVGRRRVARLRRAAGLAGVGLRKFVPTTIRSKDRPAPDLVDRAFTAEAPDILRVSDITYCPTWTGSLYLAIVLDVFSRRIVGWSMKTTLHTELVLEALNMALETRRPEGVVHHSDQSLPLA